MKTLLKNSLGHLRIIAFLEGLSFLILLFIAMPMKYFAGQPEYVKVTGMIHGILFIVYVMYVFLVRSEYKWTNKTTYVALLASVIPFGTFYADVKFFRVSD